MKLKSFWVLCLVIILATVLRLWNLPNNPPGLTWDEAALGYIAYSLYQTGRDEYGTFLPLNLKSFGDFKPALYAYLDIPFIAILGLNELAVRLPSVIFGALGVFGVYLLTKELFRKRLLSLLTAFFLAISPWHLQFSRPAFEANVALTLNIFGIYLFIRGVHKKKFLITSALTFGLSLLTYQASRLFVPIIIAVLMYVYWNTIERSKYSLMSVIILLAFLGLVGYTFLSGQTSRLSTQNFFAYQRSQEEINTIIKEDMPLSNFQFQLLHGEWWAYTKGLAERYLIYFSPKTLFIEGDYSQRRLNQ